MKRSLSLVLICLVMAGACSKVKKFEEKTESMEKTTQKMSSTTDEMKGTTTIMYQQIRSKEAESTRAQSMKDIKNSSTDMGDKLYSACVYFKAFEFQLWNANVKYEDAESREILFLDAANEFSKRVDGLYKEINVRKMSPTKDGKSNSDEMAFYALAATMHFTHHLQDELVSKNKDLKSVSFYDLVKKALRVDLNGSHMLEHEIVLTSGMNKEIMIELIKARVDILTALAVKDLTDKRDMTLGQKAKGLLFKITGGRLGSIDLPETYDKANTATKETIETRLDAAAKAKNFLREIGVSKNLDKTLKSALTNIDFNDKSDQAANKAEDKRKSNIRRMINDLLG